MPASAATARTVSPPGPSLTSTASAADSSSRSISELGVRDRRPTAPASLMQTIFSYEDRFVDPLTTIERCYTVVERYPNHIARRATPIGVCAGKPQRPPVVDPGGALPQRPAGGRGQHDRQHRAADDQPRPVRRIAAPGGRVRRSSQHASTGPAAATPGITWPLSCELAPAAILGRGAQATAACCR